MRYGQCSALRWQLLFHLLREGRLPENGRRGERKKEPWGSGAAPARTTSCPRVTGAGGCQRGGGFIRHMLILQPAEEQRLAVVCLALSLRQREGWRKVWDGTGQPHTGPWSFAARQRVLGRGQWLSALAGTGSPAFPALCHPLCHGFSGSVPPLSARCPYGQLHRAQASSSGLG